MHLGLYCSQVMLRNAFIISPKNDIEKRLVLRERFTDIGLEPVFVDAEMGTELSDLQKKHFIASDRQNWASHVMQDNALGCALSHFKIWELIANGEQDYGLIFEDDALPVANTSKYILEVLNKVECLNCLVDIIFLSRRFPERKPVVNIQDLGVISDKQKFSLVWVKYNGIGADSYILSRQAAKKLLKNKLRFVLEVDCLLHHWWINKCNVLHLNPPLFKEEGRPSTIGYGNFQKWPKDTVLNMAKRKWRRIYSSFKKRMIFNQSIKRCQKLF